MTDDLSEITAVEGGDAHEYPSYRDKGWVRVLVRDLGELTTPKRCRWEFEIIDYACGSSVFWLNEGQGLDYWLRDSVEFPGPGLYMIDNVYGAYHRGTWGFDDDDEEWFWDPPRKLAWWKCVYETALLQGLPDPMVLINRLKFWLCNQLHWRTGREK